MACAPEPPPSSTWCGRAPRPSACRSTGCGRRCGGRATAGRGVAAGRRPPGAARGAGRAGGDARCAARGARPPGGRPGRDRAPSHHSRDRPRRAARHPVPSPARSCVRSWTSGGRRSCATSRRRSIPFVEDPSTPTRGSRGARVRHRLLPLLAEENPRVVEALLALAATRPAGARREPPGDACRTIARRAAAIVGRLASRSRGPAAWTWRGDGAWKSPTDASASSRRAPRAARRLRRRRSPSPSPARVLPLVRRRSIGAPDCAAPRPAPGTSRGSTRIGSRGRSSCARAGPAIACARAAGAGSRKLSDLMIDAKIARGGSGRACRCSRPRTESSCSCPACARPRAGPSDGGPPRHRHSGACRCRHARSHL